MSTAFRNFIITFALAAALFAVVGYMAVNGILEGLFKGNESGSEEVTDYSYENAESYYDGEYDNSSMEVPSNEEVGDAYMIFYEDHQGDLIGAKLLCRNEKSGKMVFENLPVDSTIVVNGYNRPVKEIYRSNGDDFLCNKLQYVLGLSINSYLTFDTDAMKSFFTETDICSKYSFEISCSLPYEVKYEDPAWKEYNEQNPDDIQYITLAGDTVISKDNAIYIFENIPEDSHDVQAAGVMFGQIYDSVFKAVFSNKEFVESSDYVEKFFECFKNSTLKSENYSVIFGIYDGNYMVGGLSGLSSMAGKELNWSSLPRELESALK